MIKIIFAGLLLIVITYLIVNCILTMIQSCRTCRSCGVVHRDVSAGYCDKCWEVVRNAY